MKKQAKSIKSHLIILQNIGYIEYQPTPQNIKTT